MVVEMLLQLRLHFIEVLVDGENAAFQQVQITQIGCDSFVYVPQFGKICSGESSLYSLLNTCGDGPKVITVDVKCSTPW